MALFLDQLLVSKPMLTEQQNLKNREYHDLPNILSPIPFNLPNISSFSFLAASSTIGGREVSFARIVGRREAGVLERSDRVL